MAIFARKSKVDDGDRNSKKEQGSIFRPKKDVDSPKQAQRDIAEVKITQPRKSYAPPTVRRRTSSVHCPAGESQVPATPRRDPLLSDADADKFVSGSAATNRSTELTTKHSDHFPRVDMQTISDSPTLGHSRLVTAGRDRGHFQTTYSDSGYESTDTNFLSSAPGASSAPDGKERPSDLESRSAKSSKPSRSAMFHRKRGQKSNRQDLAPASQPPQVSTSSEPDSFERSALATDSSSLLLPPISTLDGLKVNTKGRLLDEEGDVIGELFEGDLLDCVRQKANAFGEVLDDYGRVVGRVRTVPRSAGTPAMQATSPYAMAQKHNSHVSSEPAPISPLLLPAGQEYASVHTPSLLPRGQDQPSAHFLNVEVETPREMRHGSEASFGALPALNVTGSGLSTDSTPVAKPDTQARTDINESLSLPHEPKSRSEKVASSPSVTFASPECSFTDGPAQDRPKPLKRAESERSATGFARSQSRMSINSILASRTTEEGSSAYTPSLFSYKGEIPAADGPQGNTLRKQPSSVSTHSRQAPPALNVKIAHVSSGAGQRRVQITDDLMGMPLTRPTLGTRNSVASSYKRSPLSSADVTPTESTDGTDHSVSDDGRSPMSYYSPTPSLYAGRTAHAQSDATSRTYFTHAGRVTVQAGEEAQAQSSPAIAAPAPAPEPVESAQPKDKEKKKRRLGLFAKK